MFAGKPLPQEERDIDYLLQAKNHQQLIEITQNNYGSVDISIAGKGLTDLAGIEKLDLSTCRLFCLYDNHLDELEKLLAIKSPSITDIDVTQNKIGYLDEKILRKLKKNNPALANLYLDDNPLEKDNLNDILSLTDLGFNIEYTEHEEFSSSFSPIDTGILVVIFDPQEILNSTNEYYNQ